MNIRRALPQEAAVLSDLAFSSKAHWGYDAKFMEACRNALTISSDYISQHLVFVAEMEGVIVGFYSLVIEPKETELDNLFINPAAMGQKVGSRLWQHMLGQAQSMGITSFVIHSDPFAEGFYTKMGAVKIGEIASTVYPDRKLPLLRYTLPAHPAS